MLQSGEVGRVVRVVVLGAVALTVGVGFSRYGSVVEARQHNTSSADLPPIYGGAGDLLDEAHRMQTPNQDRVKGLDDERHKQLQSDAAKLLALSNELKSEVDKTGKDELSVDVMRKASQIEKLAHDMQGHMKN